jgi:hypothetical protein
MLQLPSDIKGYIYEFDDTFKKIYDKCIAYINTSLARRIFKRMNIESICKYIHFEPKKITYMTRNKYHVVTIQEISNSREYRVTDYNKSTGSFRIYLISL